MFRTSWGQLGIDWTDWGQTPNPHEVRRPSFFGIFYELREYRLGPMGPIGTRHPSLMKFGDPCVSAYVSNFVRTDWDRWDRLGPDTQPHEVRRPSLFAIYFPNFVEADWHIWG